MEKSVKSWPRGFLPSLDQPIRSGEHLRRNRQADLLRRLEIDHQLKLRGLLHRKFGRLGSLQDSVHEICDAPVAVRLDLLAITHLLVAGTDQIPAPQAVGFFFKPFTNSGCRNGVLNEKSEK